MIAVLAAMGWREGTDASWMIVHAEWRQVGLIARAACGAVMLAVSLKWLFQFSKP
jgi:hypothetical protein